MRERGYLFDCGPFYLGSHTLTIPLSSFLTVIYLAAIENPKPIMAAFTSFAKPFADVSVGA